MKYFYARISSSTQNLDRQIKLFKEMGATDRTIFQETKSGKNFEKRDAWYELLEWAKSGDTIIIKNLDRLGRNAKEVRSVLVKLAESGITVESIDQAYLNNFLKEKLLNKEADSLAEAMLNAMLDTMLEVDLLRAEWERKELRKRQEEGIKRAREKGKKFGRTKNEEFREKFEIYYPLTRDKNSTDYIPVKTAIETIGCSKAMFYKLEKELIERNKESVKLFV
nr:recombinase family protein [uncultured Cetobacterium sp.]